MYCMSFQAPPDPSIFTPYTPKTFVFIRLSCRYGKTVINKDNNQIINNACGTLNSASKIVALNAEHYEKDKKTNREK